TFKRGDWRGAVAPLPQPLRQIELFLAVEERNGAHLAKVEAERIVRRLSGFRLGNGYVFLVRGAERFRRFFILHKERIGLMHEGFYVTLPSRRTAAKPILRCKSMRSF